MSIIIRLQNLPWSANALDIRQYFTGLQIPEGGVHIVGGELGDAFIAFSTDEDARQAFLRNDGKIKSVQIKLMLSSRTEMQRVIEQARTQSMAAFMLPASTPVAAPLPAAVPPVVPAAVPEIKRDFKEHDSDKKKDRKRSRTRSKSRDRRDRSRDRKDRRHRDRSRSRSRDRRDRRRRDRSKSRNRSRDKDTRRRDRAKSPKRDEREDNSQFQRDARKPMPEIWANRTAAINPPRAAAINPTALNIIPPSPKNEGPGILGAFPLNLDPTKNMSINLQSRGVNGFPANSQRRDQGLDTVNQQPLASRLRESWPPANVVPAGAVPLAVSASQRKNITNNFGRSLDNYQAPQIHNTNRASREDQRKDFNSGDRERIKTPAPSNSENRSGTGVRRSRFEDIDMPPVDACVSMEPFYGSYGDLRRFFNGLSINYRGIKVINDEFGRKTGICFVQFRDSYIKNDALKMSGQTLNKIAVKIQHISDKTFEEAVDRYNPRMDDGSANEDQFGRTRNITKFLNKSAISEEAEIKDFVCLKVEDLPTFVKEQDILHIFSQHPLISLHLDFKPKGGTIAYVKFSSKEVAKLALAEKSHHIISGKTVSVKPCKDEEFDQINKQQNVDFEEPKPKDIGTDCLSISKLPSKTNDRDISDFFSDIGVIPTKIHLMSNNLGFTGQAYCEFETSDEATRAAAKNDTVLGQNTISVVPITRSEMEGILGSSLPHPGMTPGLSLPPGTPLPPIKSIEPLDKAEPLIKPDSFMKTEPYVKSDPLPENKHVIPEGIDDSPIKLPMPPVPPLIQQPVQESPKTPQVQSPVHPLILEKSPVVPVVRGLEDLDNFNGSRGGSQHEDLNGPRGSPDHHENFIGSRGGSNQRDNFGGTRSSFDRSNFGDTRGSFNQRDAIGGARGGPDYPQNIGSRGDHRDNFSGPRGGPNHRENINGPRGGSDHRDNFSGPRGNVDNHDNFNQHEHFSAVRGGPGPRPSRFGPRLGSRFSDEGPRFNPRLDDGPRFNPRLDDGPRFNPRRDDGPLFNSRLDDDNLDDIPGCTVYMENVPYKAGTNEILDFFEGYNSTNNVSRRYNPNNTPSAEAKVTFYTPEDAYRAVRDLHGAEIWGRPIYLRQS